VMLNLGKISNPITGKVEKNLIQAKMSVDILEMFKKKTQGNLTAEEEKFLSNIIADAQLNYVAETKNEEKKTEAVSKEKNQKPEENKPAENKDK